MKIAKIYLLIWRSVKRSHYFLGEGTESRRYLTLLAYCCLMILLYSYSLPAGKGESSVTSLFFLFPSQLLATPSVPVGFKGRVGIKAHEVKHLRAMWETQVQSLGREDPLEKEMAIHSSTLAWKIPRTEEPGGLQSME